MRLKDLIGKYIRKLKREDRHSIRTVKSYESDLKLFSEFIGESKGVHEISEQLLDRYFIYHSEHKKLSAASLSRKTCSVRSFFRFLEYEDYLLLSPMERLSFTVKPHRKDLIYCTSEEIAEIFHAIQHDHDKLQEQLHRRRERGDRIRLAAYQLFCNIRNHSLFRIILDTGIRTGELVNILYRDVTIKRNASSLISRNHSGRTYEVNNTKTTSLLRRYVKWIDFFQFQPVHFFFNRSTKPLSTVTIQKTFQHYLNNTSIKRHLTSSSLRHAFAVNLIKSNTDLNTVRNKLRYKTFEGLAIYQEYFGAGIQSNRKQFLS